MAGTSKMWIRQWQESDLTRLPPSLLESVPIPEDAKQFLTETGLPNRADGFWGEEFNALPLSPDAQRHPSERFPPMYRADRTAPGLHLIGYIAYRWYGGDDSCFGIEEETGTVRLLVQSAKTPGTISFVNTDVRRFAETLAIVHFFMKPGNAGAEIDDERARVRLLRTCLRRADERIFIEKPSFWRMMLADVAAQTGK